MITRVKRLRVYKKVPKGWTLAIGPCCFTTIPNEYIGMSKGNPFIKGDYKNGIIKRKDLTKKQLMEVSKNKCSNIKW
jgi:hypothetical protein